MPSSSIKGYVMKAETFGYIRDHKFPRSHADDLRISYVRIRKEERNRVKRKRWTSWVRQKVDIS